MHKQQGMRQLRIEFAMFSQLEFEYRLNESNFLKPSALIEVLPFGKLGRAECISANIRPTGPEKC